MCGICPMDYNLILSERISRERDVNEVTPHLQTALGYRQLSCESSTRGSSMAPIRSDLPGGRPPSTDRLLSMKCWYRFAMAQGWDHSFNDSSPHSSCTLPMSSISIQGHLRESKWRQMASLGPEPEYIRLRRYLNRIPPFPFVD